MEIDAARAEFEAVDLMRKAVAKAVSEVAHLIENTDAKWSIPWKSPLEFLRMELMMTKLK